MQTAYTDAAGRVHPDHTELYAGNLGGKTLAPGLYKWSTGVLIPTSTDLTLDAKGNAGAVWIFQVAGDLTMNSASHIVLINGAKAENVYWQIAGPTSVTIGTGAHVEGNILAQKAITMKSGASLYGRALAQTAVTLIGNTITTPDSGAPAPVPAPVVTSIYPTSGRRGTTVYFTSIGKYFLPGATVKLQKAGRTDINAGSVVVLASNKISGRLAIPANAAVGSWDVVVTNTDGQQGRRANGFVVR
jgi:hypothetical protein